MLFWEVYIIYHPKNNMTFRERINYGIYNFAYLAKGRFLKSVPQILVPRRSNLNDTLQIGITTYIDRYDLFFKPLYLSLKKMFPETNIYVAVNGFNDSKVQGRFLARLQNELCQDEMMSNTFVLHDKPVGLTRLWNELLSQGNCKTTLILNDDLRIFPWFRTWIERKHWNSTISLINGTWSHFFLTKSILDEVGWFDEDFRGIGFEDMDYTARCAYQGITINNMRCQYIKHLDHQPSRTSFDEQSSTLWGPKYSSINHDTFFQKWETCDYDSGIFIKQLNTFVVPKRLDFHKGHGLNLSFEGGVCYPDRYIQD